jgi:predicted secreted protein
MEAGSVLAIYFLFFVASAFLLLPFGVRTDEEAGTPKVPGQADSAPHRFDLRRHMVRAMALSAVLTAIYIANWRFGWIVASDLDFYH